MTEQELLLDCLRRLNSAAVTYYLTGSMANNYWVIPRSTHDVDFVIQLPPSVIKKIVAAFSPDYFLDEAGVRTAYQPPYQFNAIDTRSALKVNFWLPQPTPFEQEMLCRRVRVTLFAEPAWITTAEDCILQKQRDLPVQVHRRQALADPMQVPHKHRMQVLAGGRKQGAVTGPTKGRTSLKCRELVSRLD